MSPASRPRPFHAFDYGQPVAELLADDRLPDLGPGRPNESIRAKLGILEVAQLFSGNKIVDSAAADCCLSALWLWHDFLDESHALSQEINTPEGSFWHAIMHRREPDYGNAKYWFRRVGQHPVYESLGAVASELARRASEGDRVEHFATGQWEAFLFVDLCEAIAQGQSQAESLARQVARAEWQLLFDHCYRQAIGAP